MKKDIEFKIGSEVLRGTLFIPEGNGPFPGVVFFHGRGSDRTRYLPMAQKLSENGIIGLAFDFRGCGESDGEFENQNHAMGVEDGRAGLDFLLSQNVDRKRIGIQGTSFGGFVAGMVLNDYDFIKSVVLRVPAAYSDKDLDLTPKTFPNYVYFQDKNNWISSSAYNGARNFTGNLLVIVSEKDELLSPELTQKYYDIASKTVSKKLFIQKGAGHSFSTDPEGLKVFHKVVVDWFMETL